jgi:hypothetical protein
MRHGFEQTLEAFLPDAIMPGRGGGVVPPGGTPLGGTPLGGAPGAFGPSLGGGGGLALIDFFSTASFDVLRK